MVRRGQAEVVVFGHAVYESLALGARPAVVAAFMAPWEAAREDPVQAADRLLARALDDRGRFARPCDLVRVDLAEARPEDGATQRT
jgi:hypothetical protein